MSSVIRLAPASSETPSPDQNSILADYVDRLVAPLVGLVPYERRERFRSEVLSHLEALTEDHISTGLSADEAANKAVREHGAPRPISEKFLETWFEKGARGPLEKRFGRANCAAFSVFVFLEAIYLAFLQFRVFIPYGVFYRLPLSPGQIREIWPMPLPFPEFTIGFVVLIGYPILVPFLGGWLVGRQVPVRAGAAVYHALVPLILCSFAVGALLLPVTEGLLFALIQLTFWLPVGAFVARISSQLARADRVGRMTPFR
ncbi:MAG: hypothetical protein BGO01_00390 [Armatimonadetes bacterium 55-13]|nr:MAG: hypothetical protein ABT09_01815 [bacterium SCN 57-13]OJU63157.1 MAG: hypothetical protein BGO01_00390 [Armatimonadetes bacterium 55-13]